MQNRRSLSTTLLSVGGHHYVAPPLTMLTALAATAVLAVLVWWPGGPAMPPPPAEPGDRLIRRLLPRDLRGRDSGTTASALSVLAGCASPRFRGRWAVSAVRRGSSCEVTSAA